MLVIVCIFIVLLLNLSCSDNSVEQNNLSPIVVIMHPSDNTIYSAGDTITFTGTATDPEDGELNGSFLLWTSDKDGHIGTGKSLQITSLSVNTHIINLTATDSKGKIGTGSITITILTNSSPVVNITSPSDNSIFNYDYTITFTGTATDPEDGTMSGNSFVWTSDIDGQIGTGLSFSTSILSENRHIVTLTATDSKNKIGSTNIAISVVITFEKTFGGNGWYNYGKSVIETTDEMYVIVGRRSGVIGDVSLIKTDNIGGLVWDKTFSGGGGDQTGSSVIETTDGGYLIVGSIDTSISYNYDVYLIKTDNNGNLLWENIIGGVGQDYGNSIIATTDGGYIIVGTTTSSGAGGRDVYLIKINNIGDSLWTRTIGGTGDEYGISIIESKNGGYVIVGNSGSYPYYVYLVKTDNNGYLDWDKTFDDTFRDCGNSFCETTDGNYLITGRRGGEFLYDIYLIKTDNNGNLIWEKTYGGEYNDFGNAVIETTNGNYIITGTIDILSEFTLDQDVYLIKTDNNGNLLWEKTYGGSNVEEGNSVINTNDGGYIITGYRNLEGFTSDVYLIKTDSLGNVY